MRRALAATEPTKRLSRTAQQVCGAAYSVYRGDVYRYFYARLHDPALADDLTQEVFAAALPHFAELPPNGRLRSAWLFKIAERRLADALRARYQDRAHLVPLGVVDSAVDAQGAEPRLGPTETILQSINALPPSQRVVLVGTSILTTLRAFDLTPVRVSILHAPNAAPSIIAQAADPKKAAAQLASLERQLFGSPPNYPGYYLALEDSSGEIFLRNSAEFRVGATSFWIDPAYVRDSSIMPLGLGT